MTETKTRMKVKGGLRQLKKLYWEYELLQWLAYVDNWDRSKFHKYLKSRVPGDKESRNRLILSWWIASKTCQDTLKFNYLVYLEPGLGHYVVAELADHGPQFDPVFTHWTPDSRGRWEPWDERSSSTKSFITSFDRLEEAENEAWCLDEEYFKEEDE